MNKSAILSHYSSRAALAAQAKFDNMAEPFGGDDDNCGLAALDEKIRIALGYLAKAAKAVDDGNEVAASGFIDDAVIELRGVL